MLASLSSLFTHTSTAVSSNTSLQLGLMQCPLFSLIYLFFLAPLLSSVLLLALTRTTSSLPWVRKPQLKIFIWPSVRQPSFCLPKARSPFAIGCCWIALSWFLILVVWWDTLGMKAEILACALRWKWTMGTSARFSHYKTSWANCSHKSPFDCCRHYIPSDNDKMIALVSGCITHLQHVHQC